MRRLASVHGLQAGRQAETIISRTSITTIISQIPLPLIIQIQIFSLSLSFAATQPLDSFEPPTVQSLTAAPSRADYSNLGRPVLCLLPVNLSLGPVARRRFGRNFPSCRLGGSFHPVSLAAGED